ncbi:MAG TPA: FAD-dependent oxidoreductase, partial [Vicinamibacterales bacterium]|nr:FAD-dependent oxidoreductase [Vicinamibacterales bacterium]
MTSTQLVVVGGGPGGYAAAFLAADLGLSTTLVDPEVNPGGVCVYRGCIPSKALLHVAKLVDESRHAKAWGVEFAELRQIDLRLVELDAPGFRVTRFVDQLRDVQQRLRRNAAAVDTDAAGIDLRVDQRGGQSEIGGEKRGGVAPGT